MWARAPRSCEGATTDRVGSGPFDFAQGKLRPIPTRSVVRKFADAKLPAAVPTPPSSPARRILRFGVFEVDLGGRRTAQEWHPHSPAGTAFSDSGVSVGPRRRGGHARGTSPEVVASRHLRGFRPQPEYRREQAAGGAGRLGFQSALRGNPGAARIPLSGSGAAYRGTIAAAGFSA